MKTRTKSLVVLVLILAFSTTVYYQSAEFIWGKTEKLEKIKNLQDSTKWERQTLSEDLNQPKSELSKRNMDFGAFPVNKYKQGLGTGMGANRDYYGKTLYWNFFIAEKNKVNEKYLGDKNDEVFFIILCLTDVLDFSNENYNVSSGVNSRNYPDKLGSGVIKTKNNSIEYIAFVTGDRKQFALVNQRIFDLEQGKLVLIAPQKDGSLRSMQFEMPLLESSEVQDYIKKIKQAENVKEFFLNENNI